MKVIRNILKTRFYADCKLIKRYLDIDHRPLTTDISSESVNLIKDGIKQLRLYSDLDLIPAQLDWDYILKRENYKTIEENIRNRKTKGDIQLVKDLSHQLISFLNELIIKKENIEHYEFTLRIMLEKLYRHAFILPNATHPDVPIGDEGKAVCIKQVGTIGDLNQDFATVDQIAEKFGWLKQEGLSSYSTQRAYVLCGDLAHLEDALVQYTLEYLFKKDFKFISVPDILHHGLIESCGFQTTGDRNQVYKLDYMNDYGKYCLSGTSEMSLAGLMRNQMFNKNELPLKLCAVSRCYRAEVSGSEKEGKLYRLHEFTKVEMFVLTEGSFGISDMMLNEINQIQVELFSNLGLHFKVLDMPSEELGMPAYRKYDIESWQPAHKRYGEISSTSNCGDFQSRRLNIKYKEDSSDSKLFVHTLNGTACAVPRLLTCVVETNWDTKNNVVHLPKPLQKYMDDRQALKIPKTIRKAHNLSFKDRNHEA